MDSLVAALVAAAVAFAFSLGAHYTGACMGMARASRAIATRRALYIMAPATLLGAVLASGNVEGTVGHGLLPVGAVSVELALAIVLTAFGLTSLFNLLRIPTSTIQLLVFGVVGAGLAEGLAINWTTVGTFLGVWAAAPVLAFLLGYLAVRWADRRRAPRAESGPLTGIAATVLVAVGAGASFTMGANDVSNASGAFIMTGIFDVRAAGLIGGLGLAAGVLLWGRPLLERVAFDLVRLDSFMATVAQFAQAALILIFVAFGYFTSMNQALVGAMLGTGVARRQERIRWSAVRGILLAWAVGPLSGAAIGFVVVRWLLPGGGG